MRISLFKYDLLGISATTSPVWSACTWPAIRGRALPLEGEGGPRMCRGNSQERLWDTWVHRACALLDRKHRIRSWAALMHQFRKMVNFGERFFFFFWRQPVGAFIASIDMVFVNLFLFDGVIDNSYKIVDMRLSLVE